MQGVGWTALFEIFIDRFVYHNSYGEIRTIDKHSTACLSECLSECS